MRLSIFEVTWKEIRVGKLALIVPVITSTDGLERFGRRPQPLVVANVQHAGGDAPKVCVAPHSLEFHRRRPAKSSFRRRRFLSMRMLKQPLVQGEGEKKIEDTHHARF